MVLSERLKLPDSARIPDIGYHEFIKVWDRRGSPLVVFNHF